MSEHRDPVHRDPIHRDPVYDALGDPQRKDQLPGAYGSSSLWGWIAGFILAAVVLLVAYAGSELRLAQYDTQMPPARTTPAPTPAPAPMVPAPPGPGGLPPSPAR